MAIVRRRRPHVHQTSRWGLLLLLMLLCLAPAYVGRAQEDSSSSDGDSTDVAVPAASDAEPADNETNGEGRESASSGRSEKAGPRTDAKSRLRRDSEGRVLRAQADAADSDAVNTAESKAAPSLLEKIAPGALEKVQEFFGGKKKAEEEAAAEEDAAGPEKPAGPAKPPATGPGFVPDKPGAQAGPEGAVDPRGAKSGRSGFSEEEMQRLLPGFAQDQPGSIGSQPDQVLAQPESPVTPFETLLGESMLPPGTAEEEIGKDAADPSRGVGQNFARVVVPTGTISGSTETKQFHIEGGLQIYYSKVVISADTADIDEHNEVAHLFGNVSIDDPQYKLSTDDLLINFKEKRFQASGFVQFKKNPKANASQPDMTKDKKDRVRDSFAKQQFELFCKTLYYNWETKELSALESVRLVHPSFNGTLDRLDYNDKTKVYAMSGTVVLEITNYDWVFANKLVEGDDEKKARALTDSPTKINADRVLYSEESGLAQFYSSPGRTVDFIQEKRNIKGTYIEVNDKTKDFYVEGDDVQRAVYSQQEGNWLIQGGLIKEGQVSEDLKAALLKPLTAEAGSITYNFDRKRLEMRDGVKIVSENQTVEAGEVIQDETAKFFLMRQNVVIKPDVDGYIYAAQIYMDTENDVFTFVGLVNGRIQSDELPDLTPKSEDELDAGAAVAGNRANGPAAGVFQNTGGVTFSPTNRNASATREKLEQLEKEEARRAATQQAAAARDAEKVADAAANAAVGERLDPESAKAVLGGDDDQTGQDRAAAGKALKKAPSARKTRRDAEEEREAEKRRNGDTNVAEQDS